eukprot:362513_1
MRKPNAKHGIDEKAQNEAILLDMGFDKYQSRYAVNLYKNNIQNAINYLLSDTAVHFPCDISQCLYLERLIKNINSINGFNIDIILADYFHLISDHKTDHDFLYIFESFGGFCDINKCLKFERNNRDRQRIPSILSNNDIDIAEKVTLQIHDKIHCHFQHCYDIGYRLKEKEKEYSAYQDVDDFDDIIKLLTNNKIVKIKKILHSKHKLYRNIRNKYRKTKCSKFVTNSNYQSNTNTIYTDTNNNILFLGSLYHHLASNKNISNDFIFDIFTPFISENEYDSDSIEYDIIDKNNDDTNSNIYQFIVSKQNQIDMLFDIIKQFVCQNNGAKYEQNNELMYDFGFIFVYEYSDIDAKDVRVKQLYSYIGYIVPKYSSFKLELTSNIISIITVEQFNNEFFKAQKYLNSAFCKLYVTNCIKDWKTYRKDKPQELCIGHLFAMMMYCNYDKLQYEFSKTYRKTYKLQSK